MPPREVLVTYTLYPTGNGDVRSALAGLQAQCPLRNLHWKPTSRTALRTIQEVDIKLVDLGELPPSSDKPGASVLEHPLVNICFVACDDSDIYKNNTRTFIKDWMSLVASRTGSHLPLIVLVNPPTAAGTAHTSKNVFGRDRGIIAKLKTDFNTAKKDICVQINLPPAGTVDPAVWPEVTSRLKDSIVAAYDGAILEREDEVKRGEAQRITPGWNFCTWFLLKESLAHSFEGVGLYEDALLIYEELEATFFQCVKERNIAWFWRVGGTGPQDDSFHILDTSAKRYRDLLIGNLITVFDFRIYVFACQCLLLGKLGRITEIAKRGQWFVASLAGKLRENIHDLPDFFIESWTYSACMDLVDHCDEWSRVDRPNNDYSGLIAYESARSELLDIARVQVERIGVATGHLPDIYPFSRIKDLAPMPKTPIGEDGQPIPKHAGARPPLSNRTFVAALESQEAYLELYSKLTTDALEAYSACGKGNSAVRLKTDLAALALYLEEWTSAHDLYRQLVRNCTELHVWDRVTSYAIEGALRTWAHLQKPHDDEWAGLALAYLRSCAATGTTDHKDQLASTITELRELEQSRQESESHVFNIRLLNKAASLCDDVSLTQLTLAVTNKLPVPVSVDDVRIDLESPLFGTITYSSGPTELAPGDQTVTVSCSTSIAGLVTLVEAAVVLGNVEFTTSFPKHHVVVPVHRNLQGVRTLLRMPDAFSLDEEPCVVLDINSGKQAIKDARIIITSLQDEVGYALDRAIADGHKLELSPGSIGLGDLAANTSLSVQIPYSGVPRNELARVQIVVEYVSEAGNPSSYAEDQSVYTGLPITVNVQDFFRPNAFVIASDGHEYIRVRNVDLQSPKAGYNIEPCRSKWDEALLVPPTQPLSCLFRVKPNGEPTGEVLRLSIQYRTVEEEIEMSAQSALNALPIPSAALYRAVRDRLADRSAWLQAYLLSEDIATVFDDAWLSSVPAEAAEAAKTFLASIDPSAVRWCTLRIPVDVPLQRHLTTVRLTPATPGTLYEGRALAFDIELTTSLAWLGNEVPRDNIRVTYDVQASADDWVIVGKKKGIYIADPSKPEIQRVVLVPVRHGVLTLPPVSVQLVETDTANASITPTQPLQQQQQQSAKKRVLCETYIANAALGVRILPAKTGMTALVPIAPEWED